MCQCPDWKYYLIRYFEMFPIVTKRYIQGLPLLTFISPISPIKSETFSLCFQKLMSPFNPPKLLEFVHYQFKNDLVKAKISRKKNHSSIADSGRISRKISCCHLFDISNIWLNYNNDAVLKFCFRFIQSSNFYKN